jgi:hypothetical protein
MSDNIRHASPAALREVGENPASLRGRRALVACGIAYAALYPVVNDVIAATVYGGYSRMSQAVFAPMSRREVIASGGSTSADTMHLVLAAGTGLFVAAFSAAFGWRFRAYSLLTLAVALVFGRLSAQVDHLVAGATTPYMGLLERIGIGASLLWLAVAAVVLLRRITPHAALAASAVREPGQPRRWQGEGGGAL